VSNPDSSIMYRHRLPLAGADIDDAALKDWISQFAVGEVPKYVVSEVTRVRR
jgi:hypothetical protein